MSNESTTGEVTGEGATSTSPSDSGEKLDALVVVSRVKSYISKSSGLNTSQCCIDALTRKIVDECKNGIERAKTAGRKTVMGRDIL
jgi:histone H3/H4